MNRFRNNYYYNYNPASLFQTRDIEHYYGDYVRQLFVASAALMLVANPFLGNILPMGPWFDVVGAIGLVLLAGLTSPHSGATMFCSAVLSGLFVIFVETYAINMYTGEFTALFVVREAVVVMLLFAFYFAVKTERAMAQGKVGKGQQSGEFDA